MRRLVGLLLFLSVGCSGGGDADLGPRGDAGSVDARPFDVGGAEDIGMLDGGPADSGSRDLDGGVGDSEVADQGLSDAGPDAAVEDAGDAGPAPLYEIYSGNIPLADIGRPFGGLFDRGTAEQTVTFDLGATFQIASQSFAPGTSVALSSYGVMTIGSTTATVGANGGLSDLGSQVRIAHFWDETWVRGSYSAAGSDATGFWAAINGVYVATGEDDHFYIVTVSGQGHRVLIRFLSDMPTSSGTIGITNGSNVVELPCSPNCSPREGDVVLFLPTFIPQIGHDLRISSQFRVPPSVAPGELSPWPDILVENIGNVDARSFDHALVFRRPGEYRSQSSFSYYPHRGPFPAGTSTTVTEEFGLPFAYPSQPGVWEMALFMRTDDYNPVNDFFSLGTTMVTDTTCDIATSQLALGQVGQPYSDQLTTLPGGCPSPTWTVRPALPAGLTLDATTGAITGTPVAASAGNYVFEAMQPGFPTATMTLGLLIQ